MEITKRQWYNIHRKLNDITNRLSMLEEKLPNRQKRWLNFDECVPPESICKDVNSMMKGNRTYTGFLGKLAEYYGCKEMSLNVDTSIEPKYIAVYYPLLHEARTRTKTIDKKTVLHEWFHHLCSLKVVFVDKSKEEKYADKYAKIFLQRIGEI